MNPDVEAYSYYIRKQIASIHDSLKGLSDAQITWKPDLPEANSVYQVATHVFGNARAWVRGIVCGHDIVRDRPAEFAARGTCDELEMAARKISADIDKALQKYDASDLDKRFKPAQVLWGAGDVQEITRRLALADVLEHAAMHLGQVQLTRDLALRDGPR